MASNMMKALRICGRQCFNVIDTSHCHHSTRTISTSANCFGTAKDRRAKTMVNECRERGINIIRDPQINKVIKRHVFVCFFHIIGRLMLSKLCTVRFILFIKCG